MRENSQFDNVPDSVLGTYMLKVSQQFNCTLVK